jgi:hypothetical protein
MKGEWAIFFLGAFATLLALAGSLVSSPNYNPIFVAVAMLDILATGCFARLWFSSRRWRIRLIVPMLLVAWTVLDVSLRYFAGARAPDLWT